MGRGRAGDTGSCPRPAATAVPMPILTSVKCVCFFSAPCGRNSSISAAPDWFSSNLATGGRERCEAEAEPGATMPTPCPGSTGCHHKGRERPGGSPQAPGTPACPTVPTCHLPVKGQRRQRAQPCASHWAPAPPSQPEGARPWRPWRRGGWARCGLSSGSARGGQQGSGSGWEHWRGSVPQVPHPPGMLESGSAPALVAPQGQAPSDDGDASPRLGFSLLPVHRTMLRGGLTAPQGSPGGTIPSPGQLSHSPPCGTAQLPFPQHGASPGAPACGSCPPPLPCPQRSAPCLSFPSR